MMTLLFAAQELATQKESASAILADAGLTILIGLVVVFAVLLLLTGLFKVFGMAMSAADSEEKAAPVAPAVAPIVGNTATVQSAPEIQNGIPAETVAVVSAAVACMAPAGTQYAVRSIHKV